MKNLKNNVIINKLKKGYSMIFRTRTSRIISSTLLCFCFGICITLLSFYTINKLNIQTGVGGLDSSNSIQLSDNLEELLIEDEKINAVVSNDNASTSEDILTENTDNSETDSIQAELTYQTYRVKKGDMIGVIADDFGVTQDTIISINNIKQSRLIQVGQYLKIPSMPGILYTVKENGETAKTIAEKYEINAEKCAFVNSIAIDHALSAGTSLFVPDAELDWTTRQEINGDLFKKPIRARYWLSSPYGWRDSPFNTGKRSYHGGIDMACGTGTNVYAALDGKVTSAGYNSVYGNFVIITHHSGYKSLYGHLSKITCKKGNFVYTNTKIGEVGSTGMSTGPHLHFTVYKNGKTVNPMSLFN